MKKILLNFLLLITSIATFSQIPDWQWLKKGGGESYDESGTITGDQFGHLYIGGQLYSTTSYFGNVTMNHPFSGSDLFIVKYDLMGNAKWGRNFGNGQADITKDIACDRYGFVYFVAEFGDSILDISQYNLFTKGGKDVCIVKMDTIGNVVWANSIGGLRDDYVSSIVINESDQILIGGYFRSDTMYFGNSTLISPNIFTTNYYFAKYDLNGNFIWAKGNGGYRERKINNLICDRQDNIIISGDFSDSTLIIGNDTLINGLSPNYGWTSFIAKFDSSGNSIWAKSALSDNNSYSKGVTIDSSGNSYWLGEFINSVQLADTSLFDSLSLGMYLIKLDRNGNRLWTFTPDTPYFVHVNSVVADENENVYLTGSYSNLPLIMGSISLPSPGYSSNFYIKLNSNGIPVWAKYSRETNTTQSTDMFILNEHDLFVTGWFRSSSFSLDTIQLFNNYPGASDVFLAKLHEFVVGVEHILNQEKFQIYPNPFNRKFNIDLPDELSKVRIVDLFGRIVYDEVFQNEKTIEIELFSAGIYVVELSSAYSTMRKSIVCVIR